MCIVKQSNVHKVTMFKCQKLSDAKMLLSPFIHTHEWRVFSTARIRMYDIRNRAGCAMTPRRAWSIHTRKTVILGNVFPINVFLVTDFYIRFGKVRNVELSSCSCNDGSALCNNDRFFLAVLLETSNWLEETWNMRSELIPGDSSEMLQCATINYLIVIG